MRRLAFAVLTLSASLACGSNGDAPTDAGADVTPPPAPLGTLLTIDEVAAYQTVKIDVVQGGAPVDKYAAPRWRSPRLATGRSASSKPRRAKRSSRENSSDPAPPSRGAQGAS